MREILECEEFQELAIRVSALLDDGELRLDERINSKGYLSAALKSGQIVLRATRFVGTIPLTDDLAIRIKPRTSISNLSYMLVRSGIIPAAISGFSRGYLPRFVSTENSEKIYGRSLIDGANLVAKRGFFKEYIRPANPSPWRGRLKASETIQRHVAKGLRYRHEFDHTTLSPATVENIALKAAIFRVKAWFQRYQPRDPIVAEAKSLLHDLWSVPTWEGRDASLLSKLARKIPTLSPLLSHYRDPLWTSLLILQSALPEVALDGFVKLDSLIVDVSATFESFIRRELIDKLQSRGYVIGDGNRSPAPFFQDNQIYSVHPDIIIRKSGTVVGILDVKYKPEPKEQDRYEVLSFMDATNVVVGGFVCPTDRSDTSRYLGETASGKRMFSLRYDLAAEHPGKEAERLAQNVERMLNGERVFL